MKAENGSGTGITTYSSIVRAVDHPSPERARELFAKLAANGTWVCPTLSLSRAYARASQASFREDPRLSYMPVSIVNRWRTTGFSVASKEAAANLERAFERAKYITRSMHRAGVSLLAGTDFPNPFMLPGFGLHDEMELLVEAGLSSREALRAGTTSPTRYFGLRSDSGSIAPGQRADMVLLDENPLLNIGNTRAIRAVIADGRLSTRLDLDNLLAKAKAAAIESGKQ
jgi:imidazolonepropionase-like amidohydrolase